MGRAGRALTSLAFLTMLEVTSLVAQSPQRLVVNLKGLHAGLCVELLVAPNAVANYFGGGILPIPVESLADAFPALARVARDEPTYQAWTPARYCWYLYREGVIGGRQVIQDGGRQPVAVGYLALAASGLPDSADQLVVTFFTNAGRIAGALERARIRVDEIDLTLGLIPEEESDPVRRRYTAKHGGTTVQWDGGPRNPVAVEPHRIRLLGRTGTGALSGVWASISPDSAWSSSGTLKVSGNGELQRLMAASPIRLVTSFFKGGDSDWEFGR